VKDYVRQQRRQAQEMFVPLVHPPGHGQADFGEAQVVIGGVEETAHFLAVDLPHSDACFVQAYPAETTEAFCEGHNAAFGFFGGVPQTMLYDNTKLAVARILGDGRRQRTRVFAELQSHYLFADRFGRPGKGNDKGHVEGVVGYVRRNFFVPIPRADSYEALNARCGASASSGGQRGCGATDDRRALRAGPARLAPVTGDPVRRVRQARHPGELTVARALPPQ
jgi:transposase